MGRAAFACYSCVLCNHINSEMSLRRALPPLAVLISAGCIWALWPASEPPPALPSPVTVAPEQPQAWFGTINHSAEPAEAPVVPLARQVDRLLASGKPEDAYRAYALVQACVYFARDGDLYTPGEILPGAVMPEFIGMTEEQKARQVQLCKPVTQRMLDSRLDHLAIAAKAGVRGASVDFYVVGPFGDNSALQSRPGDPLVIQWKQQAIEHLNASADKGDMASLGLLVMHRLGRSDLAPDPVRAQTYTIAWRTIIGQKAGPASTFPDETGLTSEQMVHANEEANRIVKAFRQGKGQ
jgi:hypothetical protein